MKVFFSGIGGTAIGPLAQIAKDIGYEVAGSDKQPSQYIDYLKKHGLTDIQIGQDGGQIAKSHQQQPIDWYVYSSAVAIEQPDSPELKFCQDNNIKATKRDDFINHIIQEKNLKLIAVAGTHGKTTTTAMLVWLFKELGIPLTYSVGAKISFGEMGAYQYGSEYFVLEADEFDRNFLSFHPHLSLITGVDWDHHEIFPTREDYQAAFLQFLSQSAWQLVWEDDADRLTIPVTRELVQLNSKAEAMVNIQLVGEVNRKDAWQAVNALKVLTNEPLEKLVNIINHFPGLNRRFEKLQENLYTDYAHTEEKIKGALETALEVSPNLVVVYEPLTNRRQHFIKKAYKDLFTGVKQLYWVPSYLAREDPGQDVLSPAQLIEYMENKDVAKAAELDASLKQNIQKHLENGDLVLCLSGGGGGSLDEWLRKEFTP